MTVRVAAVADLHLGVESGGSLAPHLTDLDSQADLFLLAGDYTMWGAAAEAAVLAGELRGVRVPKFGVLGNHDFHSDEEKLVADALAEGGVTILECANAVVEVDGISVGIAGAKGFGGGFLGACAADFGEPEMKSFIRHTKDIAARYEEALAALDSDIRIALLHYSPVESTLVGERLEIYPFLGSYLLGQAIDHAGADLVIHGHAHAGTFEGRTEGGIPVYNVAQSLLGRAFHLFELPVPAPRVQPSKRRKDQPRRGS